MKFENCLVAMRKGYKVQRKKNRERLNGLCFFMKDGVIYSQQTHELSQKRVEVAPNISISSIMAEDWEAFK